MWEPGTLCQRYESIERAWNIIRTPRPYIFSARTSVPTEWPDSDVDIAVLLPPEEAKKAGLLQMNDLRFDLETLLGKEVDLINLRRVPTVLQKEVVVADGRIYDGDWFASEEFEMLTPFVLPKTQRRTG